MEQDETGVEQIDADVGNIFEKIDAWLDGFLRLLPNIAVGIVVLLLFWFAAGWIGRILARQGHKHDRPSLGDVGGALVRWAIIIIGVMLAITIIAPSISPGDLFAGLGISSVAIGFAFKDILQNMLAGILILLRQPFQVGDQIVSGGFEGTVERIETRATLIKTYDGRRVVIPNADIYTDAVTVNTAYDTRRSQYDIQIGCSDDFDNACQIMKETCAGVEGVLSDPAPEALPWSMDADGNTVRLRWWTKSGRADVVHVYARVIKEVYNALDSKGVDMPYPTRMVLFHDQTEATDGDRMAQREGWPADAGGDNPAPARIESALKRRGGDRDGDSGGDSDKADSPA
ncbi:mechanosensitive ion channel family protein [Marinovum sp.]|uniref:mechanosensitive ion channel family protein n=1 Tax=Marinovum sp. TaxID=2024839 RepID=UPI002B269013|nr:mechanosensitive ion channel family protein [Marinovum sp.]